jgi:phage shock protein E
MKGSTGAGQQYSQNIWAARLKTEPFSFTVFGMHSQLPVNGFAAFIVAVLITFPFAAQPGEATDSSNATVIHADAKAAAKLVEDRKVTVLDVRTPTEFRASHITGATNVDFLAGDFAEKAAKLDRGKTYLVHCATGRRSTNCLPQLQRLGFTNLVHLDGGLKAWQAGGNAVEK